MLFSKALIQIFQILTMKLRYISIVLEKAAIAV